MGRVVGVINSSHLRVFGTTCLCIRNSTNEVAGPCDAQHVFKPNGADYYSNTVCTIDAKTQTICLPLIRLPENTTTMVVPVR